MRRRRKTAQNVLDGIAESCYGESMSMIRDVILKRMGQLNLTTYRLSKMVGEKVPQRTVYAFCSGESDASSEVVSALMEALGLTITVKNSIERGRRPRKEK